MADFALPPILPAPMLATPGGIPTPDNGWAFEIKWDGVRAIVAAGGGAVRVTARRGHDITVRYPELAGLGTAVGDRGAVLDGEVVCFDDTGRPNFGRLQHRMHASDQRGADARVARYPVMFIAFDVLWLAGEWTLDLPYEQRRDLLDGLKLAGPSWQAPVSHVGDGEALRALTAERGLEGVVAKRLGSSYEPGRRSRHWIKVKNGLRQEFVVGGWLSGSGGRAQTVGALLIGVYDGGELRYAGRVGTGFTQSALAAWEGWLAPLARAGPPFADPPRPPAHWVEPQLVVEVEFTEWTAAATLRHPSYKGRRDDIDARDVRRQT